jgi:hypothetical protein
MSKRRKVKIGDLAICGYIRLRFPDGSTRREKIPSSCHVKLGGHYIHMTLYGQRMIPIYMTRVVGGWRVDGCSAGGKQKE